MKLLLLIFSLLTLSNTYAGDRYLNCGFGSVETMDEFISSDIINGDRALSTFTIRDNDYIITLDRKNYTVYISNHSLGGFSKVQIIPQGPRQEAYIPTSLGVTCFVQD